MDNQPPPIWTSIFGLCSSFIIIFSSILIIATTAYILPKAPKSSKVLPTPTPSSWQTYTNTKYHYSLKYTDHNNQLAQHSCGSPSDFNGQEVFIITTKENSSSSKICHPLDGIADIMIFVTPTNKTSIATSSNYPKDPWEYKVENITVDSLPAQKITAIYHPEIEYDPAGLSTNYQEVVIKRYGFAYQILNANPDLEFTFNEVVSNFQLLPDTSTWKTYKNTQFSFKYPSNWETQNSSALSAVLFLQDKKGCLTIFTKSNLDPSTGKPYLSISEYNKNQENNIINISGQSGQMFNFGDSQVISFFTPDNSIIVNLQFSLVTLKTSDYTLLRNQILSTFKFLDN